MRRWNIEWIDGGKPTTTDFVVAEQYEVKDGIGLFFIFGIGGVTHSVPADKVIVTENKGHKTPIEEWVYSRNPTVRLCNIFLNDPLDQQPFKYVEDVTEDKFKQRRNAGKKTWEEFVKLRGY